MNETGGMTAKKIKPMKNLSKILAVAAASVALTSAISAKADEPALSPKAKEFRSYGAHGIGASSDTVDLTKNRPMGKAWASTINLRATGRSTPTVDVAHAPRPLMSPKDPRYDQEVRRLQEVQIAPLK
jgi:hypothetical protein